MQATFTAVVTIVLLRKFKEIKGTEGFMRVLVQLILAESISTIIFEVLFWASSKDETKPKFLVLVYSIAIGGEVCIKSISLWLFGVKYLKSSYEMPSFIKDKYGQI